MLAAAEIGRSWMRADEMIRSLVSVGWRVIMPAQRPPTTRSYSRSGRNSSSAPIGFGSWDGRQPGLCAEADDAVEVDGSDNTLEPAGPAMGETATSRPAWLMRSRSPAITTATVSPYHAATAPNRHCYRPQ